MRLATIRFFIASHLALSFLNISQGATPIQWINPSGGNANWEDTFNWNPAVVPNGDYDVTIPGYFQTIYLNSDTSINSLSINYFATLRNYGTSTFSAGSISNKGDITVQSSGGFTVSGLYENDASFTYFYKNGLINLNNVQNQNGALFSLINSTCTVAGTFTNTGIKPNLQTPSRLRISDNSVLNVGVLNNSGTVELDMGGILNLTGGGSLGSIPANATFDLGTDTEINSIVGGVATDALADLTSNAGRLLIKTGKTYNWNSVTNTGLLQAVNGTTLNIQSLTNQGNVGVISGVINVASGLSLNSVSVGQLFTVSNSDAAINRIVNGSPVDAFASINSIAGVLTLADGKSRNWAGLNVSGNFTLNLPDTTVNVTSLTNTGTITVFRDTKLNIHDQPSITQVPSNAVYELSGQFNVVNSGIESPAMANLSSNLGVLTLDDDRSYNWNTFSNSGTFAAYSSSITTTGDLNNSGNMMIANHPTGLVVNGTLNCQVNGTLLIGFEYEPVASRVSATSVMNNGAIGIFAGGLMTVGTGTPTITQGLQLFPDSILTITDPSVLQNYVGNFYLFNLPAQLAGTLNLNFPTNQTYPAGTIYNIISGIEPGGLSGAFSSVLGSPFPGGYWQVTYNNLNGEVFATAATLPEPANLGIAATIIGLCIKRNRRSTRLTK